MSLFEQEIDRLRSLPKAAFALLRYPNEDVANLIRQRDYGCKMMDEVVGSGGDLLNASGFIIAPFNINNVDSPTMLIRRECSIASTMDEIKSLANGTGAVNTSLRSKVSEKLLREAYEEQFAACLFLLEQGDAKKIVLSREQEFLIEGELLDIFSLYGKACALYPYSYVAMWRTETTGTWLVVSPEMLVSLKGEKGQTMALAGTRKREDNGIEWTSNSKKWSEKNVSEQYLVSEHIRSALSPLTTNVTESKPYTARSAGVEHLRTDFTFQIAPSVHLYNIILSLHPTPAVCGVPTDVAMQSISSIERYRRTYYAGFSGLVETENVDITARLYMSLRCMKVAEHSIWLYAGGGIMPESYVDSEWEETENKMQAIKALFAEL